MDSSMPLFDALSRYITIDIVPFHMPGHKQGSGFPADFAERILKMDITEIPGMDDLQQPRGIIAEAQDMAARAFGAEHTFFLVNGATSGIHAMIAAACDPGDKLLVPRNCHKSVIGAMVVSDVRPIYIQNDYDGANMLVKPITAIRIEQALEQHPEAVGVLLINPDYYGICGHIKQIEQIVHRRGKLLLVDEAHGAHLFFHPALPISAAQVGADMWVQSAHKTLPAFTQAGFLHILGSKVNLERVSRALALLQTTSPSYMIMASLDWARAFMQERGRVLLDVLLEELRQISLKVKTELGLGLLSDYCDKEDIAAVDPTRFTIDVRSLGLTGYEAHLLLADAGAQAEMWDLFRVIFICGVADDSKSLKRLFEACSQLTGAAVIRQNYIPRVSISCKIPRQIMSPREAFYSIIERVPLAQSVGRICADAVGAYPPGIPFFCPGELIEREGVEELFALKQWGGNLFGVSAEGSVGVVRGDT